MAAACQLGLVRWRPAKAKTHITDIPILTDVRSDPSLGMGNLDDELLLEGNRVTWSAGGCVKRSHTVDNGEILQAVWCRFRSTSDDDVREDPVYLCVLQREYVTVYAKGGAQYGVSLPCKASRVWPLPEGIIIERVMEPGADMKSPCFFSIMHPLDELRPVSTVAFNSTRTATQKGGFICDGGLRILFSSPDFPFLVTYSASERRHSLWLVRQTIDDEESFGIGPPTSINLHGESVNYEKSEIDSEVYLECAWTQPQAAEAATGVFIAHNASDQPILHLVTRSENRMQAYTLASAEPALGQSAGITVKASFTLQAVDATPVLVTRGEVLTDESTSSGPEVARNSLLDVAVLRSDGSLMLYTGEHAVAHLSPPTMPAEAGAAAGSIAGIRDGYSNRVTLELSDGSSARCSIPFGPFNPMTLACLHALKRAVEPGLYFPLRGLLLAMGSKRSEDNSEGEWHNFKKAVVTICDGKEPVFERLDVTTLDDEANDEDWEALLNSNYHREHVGDKKLKELEEGEAPVPRPMPWTQAQQTHPTVTLLLQAFHLVYQDMKLNCLLHKYLRPLASFLIDLSIRTNCIDYFDHYARDFGDLASTYLPLEQRRWNYDPAPDIYTWLLNRIRGVPQNPFPMPKNMYSICRNTQRICTMYDILCGGDGEAYTMDGPSCPLGSATVMPGIFVPCNDTYVLSGRRTPLEDEEPGSFKNVREKVVLAINRCGMTQRSIDKIPFGVSLPLLEAIADCRANPPQDWPRGAYELIGRNDLVGPQGGMDYHARDSATREYDEQGMLSSVDDDADGLGLVASVSSYRFGRDLRMKEVRRVLRGSELMLLHIPKTGLSDHDMLVEQQVRLLLLVQRQAALSVGRGMCTLATVRPLLTERIPIPTLCMSGRLPANNASVNLDVSALPPDTTYWPEFHNGVAAGLRIAKVQVQSSRAMIRTWIRYNRPEGASHAHAGVLMALGIHGHLAALPVTDVFSYLSLRHETTTVGVLLGMAASKRGSMDSNVNKMLCLHIQSLLPPSLPELELQASVQTAALIGLGLLYQGTAHRYTTEVLLSEIGKRPIGEHRTDREGHSLAAGIALGMVTLGRGSNAVGLTDLKIEDRLVRYIVGGRDPDAAAHQLHPDSMKCSCVKEGGMVNTDVTSPGATLALGLMFLKTNNLSVAARLSIPDTHFLLECVRPDFILLRVLSRNIIMWDSIVASHEWIHSHIPRIISQNMDGTRVADSEEDIDYMAIRQAHANILAGAAMSIGLKYAGSADKQASVVLTELLRYFMKLREQPPDEDRLDIMTCETCLDMVALSLGLVLAGTGHLDTFRLFRQLRRRVDNDVTYGNHMAIHMAIGFLFLGGGRYSFCTTDEAVAALCLSLYPRLPIATNDNRYHLQAFRHFYVMAAENRCIETRDVDSGKPCFVPLQIVLGEDPQMKQRETTIERISSCIVPEFTKVKSIRVTSPRYWPLSVDMGEGNKVKGTWRGSDGSTVLFVKRKTGYQDYSQDPRGLRSIMARTFPKSAHQVATVDSKRNKEEFLRAFSSEPYILAFAKHFCGESSGPADAQHREAFGTAVLYECLTQQKPEMLQTYLALYQLLDDFHHQRGSQNIRDAKIILAYYDSTMPIAEPLIQPAFLSTFKIRLEKSFEVLNMMSGDFKAAPQYLRTGCFPVVSPGTVAGKKVSGTHMTRLFGSYVSFFDFPPPKELWWLSSRLESLPEEIVRSLNPTAIVPLLSIFLKDTPPSSLLRITKCLHE